jgi:O-antigen/teichoic acid export membrane protein
MSACNKNEMPEAAVPAIGHDPSTVAPIRATAAAFPGASVVLPMRAAHISWNLLGLGLPLVIAAATVPLLLESLGSQRFGLLTLAWGLIGYASGLDLGVGRAATHRISELRAGSESEHRQIPTVLATAVRVTLASGWLAALVIAASLAFGVDRLIKAEHVPAIEIQLSIALLGVALPLQAISAAYRGVNEAYLNFRGVSVLRIVLGAANFGMPFVIALFTQKMYWLVLSIVVSRAGALWIYRMLARDCIAGIQGSGTASYSREVARGLLRFGGWFTLSSALNPIVAAADRFYIAAVISAATATAYVIPYEMVVQSLILVSAVTTVAFPYLSNLRANDPGLVKGIFCRTLAISLAGMSLVTAFFIAFGGSLLSLWLGNSVPTESHDVIRVLSLGLLPYTVGTMCIALLHAAGRTDLTAKINIAEFPFFLLLIYLMILHFGIMGAAYAWVLRVTLDAVVLVFFALRAP